MPSSARLYMAPEGHTETHVGLRQCSQMRGRWNMNESSMVFETRRLIWCSTGSVSSVSMEPPRSSSQFGPHSMVSMVRPVICERARAVGTARCPAGALSSLS